MKIISRLFTILDCALSGMLPMRCRLCGKVKWEEAYHSWYYQLHPHATSIGVCNREACSNAARERCEKIKEIHQMEQVPR